MVDVTKREQQELFPWNFMIIGFLICGLIACARVVVHDVENPVSVFLGIMVVSVLCGYIPMKIAYEKQSKHRQGIYILSVVAMSVGSLLISIPAIVWACCDKKIDSTTAKNTQDKNTKRKTTTYDWQDWD